MIVKVAVTRNGRHAVTVTGEDKCIRVFSLGQEGELQLLSARYTCASVSPCPHSSAHRCMLKRPCAITTTFDDRLILCADKFGDVYGLPLLQEDDLSKAERPDGVQQTPASGASKAFVPAANDKTIHTVGNLRALQNQLRAGNVASVKKGVGFEQRLLLGHVSMLTDIVLARPSDKVLSGAGQGSYIITSDRDEHIRVTRGPPQTHIIHGFCLGHTEFVSRICLPHWQPQTLVSGGGDGTLRVWSWWSGELRQTMELESLVRVSAAGLPGDSVQADQPLPRLAVTGIWSMAAHDGGYEKNQMGGRIILTFEA